MSLVCPQCGSNHLRKLEAICEEQTYRTQTAGIATSFSFQHGITNHLYRSNSKTSSKLAQKIAPPTHKGAGKLVLSAVLIFFIGLPLNTRLIRHTASQFALSQPITNTIVMTTNLGVLFGVIPALLVVGGHRVWRYNREIYPKLRQTWLSSWRCEQCGNISVQR